MAKIIKVNEEIIASMQEELLNALRNARMADGKFTFQKSFDKVEQKANLMFTEMAWLKMQMLIQNIDKEVAWHGVVKRGDENEYIVSDILVYPQKVAAATVESDDDEYPLWYAKLTDTPEVFENLRMQGHSHVNMGVTPSSTDLNFYNTLLADIPEDSFYVFVIYNKKGDKTVKIYDFAKNILFETADVDVSIIDEGNGLDQFLKDAKEMVKTQTYTTQKKATTTNSPAKQYNYGYYGQSWTGGYQNTQATTKSSANKKYDDYDDFDSVRKSKYATNFKSVWDFEDDF